MIYFVSKPHGISYPHFCLDTWLCKNENEYRNHTGIEFVMETKLISRTNNMAKVIKTPLPHKSHARSIKKWFGCEMKAHCITLYQHCDCVRQHSERMDTLCSGTVHVTLTITVPVNFYVKVLTISRHRNINNAHTSSLQESVTLRNIILSYINRCWCLNHYDEKLQ